MSAAPRRPRRKPDPATVLSTFTCEHCGEVVRRYEGEPPRNHCPACLWSKHVEIGGPETGNVGYPPCGAMMRPTDVGGEEVVWRCLGCGFTMRAFTDDYIFRALATGLVKSLRLTVYPKPGSRPDP